MSFPGALLSATAAIAVSLLSAALVLAGAWPGRESRQRRSAVASPQVPGDVVAPAEGQADDTTPPAGAMTQLTTVLFGALFLLLAAALLLGNGPLLSLGAFAFFVAVLGLLVQVPSRPEIQRRLLKPSVWVDEPVTIEWEVTVRDGIGPVFVFDHLAQEMELVQGTNIRVFWKGPGHARFTHSYSVRCPKRGLYELPPTQWEARHPLDFRQPARGASEERLRVSVLPRILAVRRVHDVRGLAATPYPMADLARVGVATTDFKEIREYRPGDPIRNINWKATARQALDGVGHPLVNQFELEGKKALWLFFDSSRPMGVGTTVASPLEHAIEAASTIGYFYLTRGYYLGAHFSARPNGFLYADSGRRQFHRLTQELLTLHPDGERYDLLSAVRTCETQLLAYMPRCVILTRLDREVGEERRVAAPDELSKAVRKLLSFSSSRHSRISVWVVAINAYTYPTPGQRDGAMAASLRGLESRPLVRELRRSGASVLEWDPFRESFAHILLRQLKLERGAA